MKKNKKLLEWEKLFKAVNLALSLGFIIILPILIFLFIGMFLDNRLNTSPIITLIFLLLGIIGGIYSAIKEIQKTIK
jgi:ATP synthase protein I